MPRRLLCLLVVVLGTSAGCGGGSANGGGTGSGVPAVGPRVTATPSDDSPREVPVEAQGSVTKNTSRLGGRNPAEDAAAVALATFPSRAPDLRPAAVAIADAADWHAAISAGALMSRPLRAPLLLAEDGALDDTSAAALKTLEPTGVDLLNQADVIMIGAAKTPGGHKALKASGTSPAQIGAAVDDVLARAAGRRSRTVIVAGSDDRAAPFSMPAAGLAAKTGAPVLWTGADALDEATRAAIAKHGKDVRIYVVGPTAAVGDTPIRALRKLGRVRRIGAEEPVANAVAVARYGDGSFGWRVVDPGHGFVFSALDRTADAGAAAPLSASGSYGPLLLLADARELPPAVEAYLLDVQPGYDADPVRGVYNHGWVIGDDSAVASPVQARIDGLLEIQSVGG